ncbi:MAG: PQQ-binding-like beta-propeller repeat protein [Acidobacteriota bacterium]|nr:PQQ-binding-like beta-propeller repeat protein [Acidobacteriota bacterium]
MVPTLRFSILVLCFCLLGLGVALPSHADGMSSETADSVSWPGFRGPVFQGRSDANPRLPQLRDPALAVEWKQDLGPGYSGVVVDDGLAVAFFAEGGQDKVVAFDSSTGERRWTYAAADTYIGHDGSHDGPISTPLLADGRVFALAPRGELFALDTATGEELWKLMLPEALEAQKPHYGFSTSPLLVDGHLIVEIGVAPSTPEGGASEGDESEESPSEENPSEGGAEGGESAQPTSRTVAAFDPATGEHRWTAVDDGVNYQSPLVWDPDPGSEGGHQLLIPGDRKLAALDPTTGEELWSHEFFVDMSASGNGALNPVPAGPGRLFLNHARHESKVLQVQASKDGTWSVEELWSKRVLGNTYVVPVYYDGHIYGYTTRIFTCVDAATGEIRWRSREPGDGFPTVAGDRLVVLTKKGSLHLIQPSPEQYIELAELDLFGDVSWTPPSLAGGRIYARSMSEIASIAVRPAEGSSASGTERVAGLPPAGSPLAKALEGIAAADDKSQAVDQLMESIPSFPWIEDSGWVHFLYRGDAQDVSLAGDMIGDRIEEPMHRAPGTDLFHWSHRLEPDAQVSYKFIRNFDEDVLDPGNPAKSPYQGGERSRLVMPQAPAVDYLAAELEGRWETHEIPSEAFEVPRKVEVYLPHGYEEGSSDYPLALIHGGGQALAEGDLRRALDGIAGTSAAPFVAAFVHLTEGSRGAEVFGPNLAKYVQMMETEVLPFLEETYRLEDDPQARAHVGFGFLGGVAVTLTFRQPDLVAQAGVHSTFMLSEVTADQLLEELPTGDDAPQLSFYVDWGKYDPYSEIEAWDIPAANRYLSQQLKERGHQVQGREHTDAFGWSFWQHRYDDLFGALFPLEAADSPAAGGR